MTITPQDIPGILEKHKKWLWSEEGGQYANLRGADLRGADLRGADLSGAKVAEGSKVAIAGPVGNCDRQVLGVRVQADNAHKKPWLLLICGCFSGDEKQYKARVDEIYKKGSEHHKQCIVALSAIKAIAKTWGVK
jgi:Pentapeptide repeats (8 copies)